MPRYIDADKLYPDCLTKNRTYAITTSQIANTPTADVIERSAYNQVAWERDTAIAQLASIGKGFGEKMDDVVVRKRGKWNDIDAETYTWKIRCDQCGHERSMLSTGQTYPRFCENCGAYMREESDNG